MHIYVGAGVPASAWRLYGCTSKTTLSERERESEFPVLSIAPRRASFNFSAVVVAATGPRFEFENSARTVRAWKRLSGKKLPSRVNRGVFFFFGGGGQRKLK